MRRERLEAAKKLGTISRSVQTSSNEFLNTQIYIILTTKYKKEAKEAFKYVEAAGYIVRKNSYGTWTVENPHTGKYIWTSPEVRHHYNVKTHKTSYYTELYSSGIHRWCPLNDRVDLVNMLKTPVNTDWKEIWSVSYYGEGPSKAVCAYRNKIKYNKNMVRYYGDDIEKYKKQIQELQEKIVYAAQMQERYTTLIKEAKKELGV